MSVVLRLLVAVSFLVTACGGDNGDTQTSAPTASVEAAPASPEGAPIATSTLTPESTPSPTPEPTATALPTPTQALSATPAPSAVSEPAPSNALVLESGGLGAALFGDPEVEVMRTLVAVLGEPAVDESMDFPDRAGIHFGYPADHRFRLVQWDGITVVFSDGVEFPDEREGSVMIAWGCSHNCAATTQAGIGVGSNMAALGDAYGDDLRFFDDEFEGWWAALPGHAPEGTHPRFFAMAASLTGNPEDPATEIGYLHAGVAQAP